MATGLGLEFESSCGQVPLGSATPDIGGRLIGNTTPFFVPSHAVTCAGWKFVSLPLDLG
jgi:hypothetical protein